jgi:4'-phosphopantetheinyl transferase EntD
MRGSRVRLGAGGLEIADARSDAYSERGGGGPAARMIELILPDCVIAVDTNEDVMCEELHPIEAAIIARAVAKRRREFITARACAHTALRLLGLPDEPIGAGEDHEPLWPRGVTGSITHCEGYRAAALARSIDVAALGIDATPHAALTPRIVTAIARPEEITRLRQLARATPEIHFDCILFSAKEAAYKAWFPLVGRRLGFEDACVTIDSDAGTFVAELLVPTPWLRGARSSISGRWVMRNGLVLTATAQIASSDRTRWHYPPDAALAR